MNRSSKIEIKQEEIGRTAESGGGRDEGEERRVAKNLSGVCITQPNNPDRIESCWHASRPVRIQCVCTLFVLCKRFKPFILAYTCMHRLEREMRPKIMNFRHVC